MDSTPSRPIFRITDTSKGFWKDTYRTHKQVCRQVQTGTDTSRSTSAVRRSAIAIGHLNACSLRSKTKREQLAELINKLHTDVVAISETWWDATFSDGEVQLPGYRVFRHDRQHGTHGGCNRTTLFYPRGCPATDPPCTTQARVDNWVKEMVQ